MIASCALESSDEEHILGEGLALELVLPVVPLDDGVARLRGRLCGSCRGDLSNFHANTSVIASAARVV